jgi:hypothetical protein
MPIPPKITGSMMEVMQKSVVQGFKGAVSCDDTADECGMDWR